MAGVLFPSQPGRVRECVQHGLLKPFDVQVISNNAESTDLVASFTITCASPSCSFPALTRGPSRSPLTAVFVRYRVTAVAVTKTGTTRLTPAPVWYSADKVKSAVEITNEETKALLTKSLKPQKKKNTDKKKADGEKKE